MIDFLGYNKEIKSTQQLVSSEFAILTAGGPQSLLQQVGANYAQELRPIYEIGSPAVYWIGGHSSGQITVSRLVGTQGILASLGSAAGTCGAIDPVRITLQGGSPCFAGGGSGILFGGSMLESVNFNLDAGRVEIAEGFNLRVSSMSKS